MTLVSCAIFFDILNKMSGETVGIAALRFDFEFDFDALSLIERRLSPILRDGQTNTENSRAKYQFILLLGSYPML